MDRNATSAASRLHNPHPASIIGELREHLATAASLARVQRERLPDVPTSATDRLRADVLLRLALASAEAHDLAVALDAGCLDVVATAEAVGRLYELLGPSDGRV